MTRKLHAIRWWAFQKIFNLVWKICPQPQRSQLQKVTNFRDNLRRTKEMQEREAARAALSAKR